MRRRLRRFATVATRRRGLAAYAVPTLRSPEDCARLAREASHASEALVGRIVDAYTKYDAQKQAQQDMLNQSADIDYSRAAAQLAAATAQLRTLQQIRKAMSK